MVGVLGIEPNMLLSDGVTVRCLTLRRHTLYLVAEGGNDPPTFRLSGECSTTELHGIKFGIGAGSRTPAFSFGDQCATPTAPNRLKLFPSFIKKPLLTFLLAGVC